MKTKRTVCVIILNYNGLSDTLECVASLRASRTKHGVRICVLDNGSREDKSGPIRGKVGETGEVVRSDINLGFAAGCNCLISRNLAGDVDYFLLLNNDTAVDVDSVEELVRVAERDPNVGIVGAKIYCYSMPTVIWSTGGFIDWWFGDIKSVDEYRPDFDEGTEPKNRDWVSGCAMLIRTQLLERISLLDEDFFQGGEDYEFCARTLRAGYKVVYAPSAKVWHKVSASKAALMADPGSLRRFIRAEGASGVGSRLKFFRKCATWPPAFVPLFFCLAYSYPKYVARQLLVYRRSHAIRTAVRRWFSSRGAG